MRNAKTRNIAHPCESSELEIQKRDISQTNIIWQRARDIICYFSWLFLFKNLLCSLIWSHGPWRAQMGSWAQGIGTIHQKPWQFFQCDLILEPVKAHAMACLSKLDSSNLVRIALQLMALVLHNYVGSYMWTYFIIFAVILTMQRCEENIWKCPIMSLGFSQSV